jgi:hypothetical protein
MYCCGCGGHLWLTPNGHRVFYQSASKQLSCYGANNPNCCYPYQERLMICTEADSFFGGNVVIRYITDK